MATSISEVVGQEEPILEVAEDKLHRSVVANLLLEHIQNTSPSYNEVIAIRGSWGSGKSSILNLAEVSNVDETIKILRFNPWYFHSIENIIQQYFGALASFLEENNPNKVSIATRLRKYGDKLARVNTAGVEVLIGGKATWLLRFLQSKVKKDDSFYTIKEQLKTDISELDYRIAIFIDDLDRLSKEEILIVFKLIKLLADFKNICHVVTIDFDQVNEMLELNTDEGSKYLEKIFSSIVDVPELTPDLLRNFTILEFQKVIATTEYEKLVDSKYWENVYSDVIQPLISTPRDVKRICQNLYYCFHVEKLMVNPVDIIAMETIRVIRPQAFNEIFKNATLLTSSHTYGTSTQNQKTNPLRKSFAIDPTWTDNLINSLFPFAKQFISNTNYPKEFEATWMRERRVATKKILDYYFTKYEDAGFKLQLVAERIANSSHRSDVSRELEEKNSREIETVLELLLNMAKDGSISNPEELLIGVFDNYPKLKKREPESVLDLGAYLAVRRLVVGVMQGVEDKDRFASTVFEKIDELLAKIHFVEVIGNIPNVGQGFISQDLEESLSTRVAYDLSCLDDETFFSVGSPVEVLTLNAQLNKEWVCSNVNPQNPKVAEVIFRDAVAYGYKQEMGSRSGEVTRVLNWAALRHIYGSDDQIQEAFNTIEKLDDELRAIEGMISEGEQKGFFDFPQN